MLGYKLEDCMIIMYLLFDASVPPDQIKLLKWFL